MKRKRKTKNYRSLADVRFARLLLDFAGGLPVTLKQYDMLNNRMKKERKYTAKQFANLWLECYLETKEEYEKGTIQPIIRMACLRVGL